MNKSKLLNDDPAIVKWYSEGFGIPSIARMIGVGSSSIEYRLKINGVKMRSKSEACKGPKSDSHKKALSESRIGKFTGSDNPNWRGGKENERQKKVSALKRSPEYKKWRSIVLAVGYCQACGSTERLEAHHVLPKALFPHLVFVVSNGMALCHQCHKRLHRGIKMQEGELLGSPERVISSQAEIGISLKVQRLGDESRTDSNSPTSALRESEDIV